MHSLPCHHNLEKWLDEYIEAAGIAGERKTPLFRTAADRSGKKLTANGLYQQDAYRMIGPRCAAAWERSKTALWPLKSVSICPPHNYFGCVNPAAPGVSAPRP
jgi:integrase/recombinase XerD